MAKNRKGTFPVLIDIEYKYSQNKFEEEFGEHITYSSVEQESYIELKQMVFELICKDIKFRKFRDFNESNYILTLRVEMLDDEYDKFLKLVDSDVFNFVHNFYVSDVKLLIEK